MTFRERFRIALRYTVPSQRGQLSTFLSSLSMLGLVLAIALLIIVLSVMNGFDKEMRERILEFVPHITVYSHFPLVDYDPQLELLQAHPQVSEVTPFARFDALILRGVQIETAQGVGVDTTQLPALERLLSGIEPAQRQAFSEQPDGLVLGAILAERLGVAPGERLTLVVPGERQLGSSRGARFQSVQLLAVLRTGTEIDEHMALVPLPIASELAGLDGGISGFRVVTTDLFDAQRIGWELTSSLPGGFYSTNWKMTHGNLYSAIQLSRDLISILLFSIIAVAAFNVVSSLVLVVLDKRGNIAILRSLGASGADVAWIFIAQGAMIGLVGVVLGSVSGALCSLAVPGFVSWLEALLNIQFLNTDVYPVSFVPVDLRLSDVLWIGSIAMLMCVLAAVYPARRAAKLAPAVALNQEH